jgi:acyl carrier protein
MPLTPNGKIDRKALSKFYDSIDPGEEYLPPTNNIEKRLVEIWRSHLGLENVGITSNFFNMGGDSIKAIKLINLINSEFSAGLMIADLYQGGTIKKVAEKINQNSTDQDNVKTSEKRNEYREVLGEISDLRHRIIDSDRGQPNDK